MFSTELNPNVLSHNINIDSKMFVTKKFSFAVLKVAYLAVKIVLLGKLSADTYNCRLTVSNLRTDEIDL